MGYKPITVQLQRDLSSSMASIKAPFRGKLVDSGDVVDTRFVYWDREGGRERWGIKDRGNGRKAKI